MSVPINLRQLPSQVKQSAYFPTSNAALTSTTNPASQLHQRAGNKTTRQGLVPLTFPATNIALWDKTPIGSGTTLHIAQERNLHVHILEKTLRLAYRHASQHKYGGRTKAFLLGQALTSTDDDGITVSVDRFDPGHEIKPGVCRPTAKLPGDHVIPLSIAVNKEFDSKTHTEEDFKNIFQLLQHQCCSREPVDVANLVSLRIHCCCYANDDDITFSLHVAGVTIATSLDLVPVAPIPVIPTALARNLVGPLNLSEVQGHPKSGFVTLDQTRKLLLLLESDPKAYSQPLVGIWLSGISYLGSPIIWATCLRYMLNSSIQERVCNADDGFLVIIYSPNKRKPDFYQCTANSKGDDDGALSFQLVGCRENLHVFKHANVTNQAPIQMELRPARGGPNKALFLEAYQQFKPISWKMASSSSGSKKASKRSSVRSRVSEAEDDIHMMPRPSPKPIMEKSPTVRPSVPEISLIFDNFEEPHSHNPSPHSQANQFGNDDVFLSPNTPSQQPHHHNRQGKENPHQHPMTKPGYMLPDRARQSRPGPLREIDQNSPHGVKKRTRKTNNRTPVDESQPRKQVTPKFGQPLRPMMQRSSSESAMMGSNGSGHLIGQGSPTLQASTNQRLSQRNSVDGDAISHANATHKQRRTSAPMPCQAGSENLSEEQKRQSLPGAVVSQQHSHPVYSNQPYQDSNGGQILVGTAPGLLNPHCPDSQSNNVNEPYCQNTGMYQTNGTSSAPGNGSREGVDAKRTLKPLVNYSESMINSLADDSIPEKSRSPYTPTTLSDWTPSQSSNYGLSHSSIMSPISQTVNSSSQHQRGLDSIPEQHQPIQMQNTSVMSNQQMRVSPNRQSGNLVSQHQRGLDNPSEQHHPMQNTSNQQMRVSPNRHRQTGNLISQHQRGLDNPSEQHCPMQNTSNQQMRLSPYRQSGNLIPQNQRGMDNASEQHRPIQNASGNHHGESATGNPRVADIQPVDDGSERGMVANGNDASGDAYEQLRRQEQMIKQLQAQIQMLLHVQAQQALSTPSGVMTPPATPTSTSSTNQTLSTPVNQNYATNRTPSTPVNQNYAPGKAMTTSTNSTNQTAITPVNQNNAPPTADTPASSIPVNHHHSPPTNVVSAATSPGHSQGHSVSCSVGVNTGQSLMWTPGTKSRKSPEKELVSETKDGPSRQHRSPQQRPAVKDAGNSTFDIDSEPNMTFDVEGARDETHSGISMIGPIEMDSSLDTNSKTSSPKRLSLLRLRASSCSMESIESSSNLSCDMVDLKSPHRHDNDQPSHLSDSFKSPVLGESASTCRPPGRPLVSSDSEDEERGPDGAPSLLYRDQRKFYNNILGNVKQLLHDDPNAPGQKQPTQNDNNDSSTDDSDSSSEGSEESDSESTIEEDGLLGLKLSLPDDFDNGATDKSVMHRSIYNVSPDFFPRINYVSIMDLTLDSPNLSMEANALAMKYLSDDELAKLSVGFKSHPTATPRNDVNPLLRTALVGSMMVEKSMMGVSSVGFRASVDMSMASRKYMEKYGLIELENDDMDNNKKVDSPKKKGKKKKKKRSKVKNDAEIVCAVQDGTNDAGVTPSQEIAMKYGNKSDPFDTQTEADDRIRSTPTLHPNQVSPVSLNPNQVSPKGGANESYEPWLKRPAPKKLQEQGNLGAFQALDKGHERSKGHERTKPVGNILDISRLQDLPKLL